MSKTKANTPQDINPDEHSFKLSGIAYILTMDGDKHYVRQNQPCYGELRKYEKTHKGECTQPHNPKPGDLHNPFPEGTPTSLVIPIGGYLKSMSGYDLSEETDNLLETMFSIDSPWAKGFGSEKSITFIRDQGRIYSVKLSTDLDTTILVNSLKVMQGMVSKVREFNELISLGMDRYETLCVLMLNGINPKLGLSQGDGYTVNPSFSFKRYFNREPNDLTGGLLCDRVDYNRTYMADVFKTSGLAQWNVIGKGRLPAYGSLGYSAKEFPKGFVKTCKDLIGETIDKEPSPVTEKYIWKTTSGRTNAEV